MQNEALLYEQLDQEKVHCFLCNHHCHISKSAFGFCNVRQNIDGKLYTHVYGKLIAEQTDPIEKKPLYHFLPGSSTYSIGTPGCNFHCDFCQNWQISQFTTKKNNPIWTENKKPDQIINAANQHDCQSISYTYTEPTIFY